MAKMTDAEKIKKLEEEVKSLKERIKNIEASHALEYEYIQDDIKHLYRLLGL